MEDNDEKTVATQPTDEQNTEPNLPEGRLPYHAPSLTRYGGLVELVRFNPNIGPDGSIFPDCTFS